MTRQKKQLDELRLVVADSQQIGEQNILLTLYTELAEPLAGLVHLSHQYSQTKLSLTGDVISNIHQVIQVLEKHGMISQGQPGQITVFDSDIHSPIFASDTPAPGDSVIIEFPGIAFHDQIILKSKSKKGGQAVMTGRFAVDFGTSNTLVTQWDEMKGEATPISIPEYSRIFIQGGSEVSVIPSIIHYAEQNRQWIGQQVMSRGLYQSPRTFRWMKRFITNRSPIHIKIDGVKITPYEAGRDFCVMSFYLVYRHHHWLMKKWLFRFQLKHLSIMKPGCTV